MDREPEGWKDGSRRARAARQNAGRQIAESLVAADITGSREFLARRLRNVAEAEREGDDFVKRGAYLDLAVAAGAMVAAIDVRRGGTE